MKLSKEIDFQNVAELSRLLRSVRASRERFSLEIPIKDCANGLFAAFRDEVEYWGGSMDFDEDTRMHILDAARWLTDPEGKPGLLMCGLCGNGKTTLAKAIKRLIEYITRNEFGYSDAKIVRYLTAKEVCRAMKTDRTRYEGFFTEEMLIVDELGEEPREIMTYGSIETPMIDLICERYDRRLFTIITTNLNTDELAEKYGARIYDRFGEMMMPIVFENKSYRMRTA